MSQGAVQKPSLKPQTASSADVEARLYKDIKIGRPVRIIQTGINKTAQKDQTFTSSLFMMHCGIGVGC